MADPKFRKINYTGAKKTHLDGPDPEKLIRWMGLAVMFLLLIAVGAGFGNHSAFRAIAGVFAWLGPLAEPIIFGVSILEVVGLILLLGLVTLSLWRTSRR